MIRVSGNGSTPAGGNFRLEVAANHIKRRADGGPCWVVGGGRLEVAANQIKRAEEWATCWMVVVAGLGARFVSKSVTSIKHLVAKVFSVVEGRTVSPSEVQRVEARKSVV